MLDPTKERQRQAGAMIARRLRSLRVGEAAHRKSEKNKTNRIALDIVKTLGILSKLPIVGAKIQI